jgi:hypothetical protein
MMFKLFKVKPDTVTGRCANCIHFCNDPAFLERNMPGMASMSSAHASIRSDDGICARHDRYLSARSSCPQYESQSALVATNCHMVVTR